MDLEVVKEFFRPTKWKIILAILIFLTLPVILSTNKCVFYAGSSKSLPVKPGMQGFFGGPTPEYVTLILTFTGCYNLMFSVVPLFGVLLAYTISCLLIYVKDNYWIAIKEAFKADKPKVILTTILFAILFMVGVTVMPWIGTYESHRLLCYSVALDPLVYNFNLFLSYSAAWLTGMMTSTTLNVLPNQLIPYSSCGLATGITVPNYGNPIGSNIFGFIYDIGALIVECYILACVLFLIYRKLKNRLQ